MSTAIVSRFPSTPSSSCGGVRVMHREPVPMEGSYWLPASGAPLFITGWELRIDSRLFVCENSLDFARKALPPTTVGDMDAMGSVVLSHNMVYVAAQALCYCVATWSFNKEYDLLAAEKASVEVVRSPLENDVDVLTQSIEGGVTRILHTSFVVGEEFGRANLKAMIDVETYDTKGQLDMAGLRLLCAFDVADDPIDGHGNSGGAVGLETGAGNGTDGGVRGAGGGDDVVEGGVGGGDDVVEGGTGGGIVVSIVGEGGGIDDDVGNNA
ncbi:unnamed protein product [Lactuca saligna]|uniref:Uncharacterized protein n=1 Tax=Lactuca saligna TaxID=75948 RepID=A0AA36E8M7_LACSI|nr:unnamed protein product [Lactuca saligna]